MKVAKTLSTVALPLALLSTPAFAQSTDYDWSGIYVGGSVGIGLQNNDVGETVVFDTNRDGNFTDTVRTVAGANAFSPGFCNGSATVTANTDCTNDEDDLEYSVRLGFDKQSGPVVYGIVLDAQKSESTDSVSAFSTTPARYTLTRELDYGFGARARLGYAPGEGRGLFYVTGGGAYGNIKNSFSTSNGANAFAFDEDDWSWGYSAGGGAEVKLFGNVSLGLEYLYTKYYDADHVVSVNPGTAPATNPFLIVNPAGTDMMRDNDNFDTHNVRLTAAFRF